MDWKVTATTIHCEFVGNYAVLMAYDDGTMKCAYFNRWNAHKEGEKRLVDCKGLDCSKLSEFKEHAFSVSEKVWG